MIFVTGDIHGNPRRLNTKCFPEQKDMTRDDYVIILGDFGLVWDNSKEEKYWLDWLESKPFTLVFVDGNHENFDLLNSYPVISFHGGKAHQIRDNIYHLIRGYVFNLDGEDFFAFGGARSHDINILLNPEKDGIERTMRELNRANIFYRVKGYSWWEQEMPTDLEMWHGYEELSAHNMKVDYVISHCAPQQVASLMGYREKDELKKYFNSLLGYGLQFKNWMFGHYHENKNILLHDAQFTCIFEQIIRIK